MTGCRGGTQWSRMIALLLLVTYLPSCVVSSWHAQTAPVPEVIASERPDRVQVTLSGGGKVELYAPAVTGDSLIGYPSWRKESNARIAIAIRDIQGAAISKPDGGRTLLLTGFGLGVIVLLAALVAHYLNQSEKIQL